MRARSLHRLVVSSAALALVCFCSCERHHADELPVESEHAKSEHAAAEAPHDRAKADQHHASGDQQQMSTTALTPTPSPTPANFFPESSPH